MAACLAAQISGSWTPILPYPLTEAEKASARACAQKYLTETLIPSMAQSPDFYDVEEIDIKDPRLDEPFLDVMLRGRSFDDFLDSDEEDPRLFASVLRYGFPVFVSGRNEPILSILVMRNRDENRNKLIPEEGDVAFCGIYLYPGTTEQAIRLRERFGAEISFVQFLDAVFERIMVEDSTGILSGFSADSLVTLSEDARTMKRYLKHQRGY